MTSALGSTSLVTDWTIRRRSLALRSASVWHLWLRAVYHSTAIGALRQLCLDGYCRLDPRSARIAFWRRDRPRRHAPQLAHCGQRTDILRRGCHRISHGLPGFFGGFAAVG